MALSLQNLPGRLKEARIEAEKAVALDPNLSEAHAALAAVFAAEWSPVQADREFRRSIDLNPNSLDGCGCYALFLTTVGRQAEALAMAEHAELVNPLSSVIHFAHGTALYRSRRYSEAEPHLKKALELEPQNLDAAVVLSLDYEEEGRAADAVKVLDRPEFRRSALMALAYAKAGRRADALKLLQAANPAEDRPGLALAYFALGDSRRGFEFFREAVDAHDLLAPAIISNPGLEAYRSDPRFQSLMERMHFPK